MAPPGLQCGDVISIFDFQFGDGSTADSKYFVVMGYHLGQALGFLTTSKEKGGRKRKDGCHIEFGNYPSNFYMALKNTPFSAGTWVLLLVEFMPAETLTKKLHDGKAVRVCTLPDQQVRALRNCFERSPDWSPIYATTTCGK